MADSHGERAERNRMLHIIYPERRTVSEEIVIGWAQDELVNAVIQHKQYQSDADLEADIASVHASDEYRNLTLDSARAILEDSGAVTFTR